MLLLAALLLLLVPPSASAASCGVTVEVPCVTSGDCARACAEGICSGARCTFICKPPSVVCREAAGPCDVAETCTGTTADCPSDALRPSGEVCRAASCAGGIATLAATCDGAGASCQPLQTQPCAPYLCGAAACRGDCGGDADCQPANSCSAGVCAPAVPKGPAGGDGGGCGSAGAALAPLGLLSLLLLGRRVRGSTGSRAS
jgi:hypothetical protein